MTIEEALRESDFPEPIYPHSTEYWHELVEVLAKAYLAEKARNEKLKRELEDMTKIAEKCLDPEYMARLSVNDTLMATIKELKIERAKCEKLEKAARAWRVEWLEMPCPDKIPPWEYDLSDAVVALDAKGEIK